jgi:hypothetical protein
MTFISNVPEWVYLIVTLIYVLLSQEVGYRFGTRRRLKPGDNPVEAAGTMAGTAIGLLAFMLAFTFNGAASNHHARKDLVIEEANTIRTAYLQSMALPDPYRARVHDLLQEYLDIRVNAMKFNEAELQKALKRTTAIQSDLWSVALTLQQKEPNAPMVGPFTDSLQKIFNLHVQRFEAALQTHIPALIWIALYLLTFFAMAMIGYRIGLAGPRSTFIAVSMAMAFSAILLLIITLDRPVGLIKISQKPLVDVLATLHADH